MLTHAPPTAAVARQETQRGNATDGAVPDSPTQMVAVLHAHSHASTGTYTVSQLARAAREAGVDVVFLTENLGYEFRYAPWPMRYFFEAARSIPGVEGFGLDRWLREVDEAQRSNPSRMLFVGVEVPPYYYWTGSPLTSDLTLHDMQRNMLVLAPPMGPANDAGSSANAGEADAFFRNLPAVGNRTDRGLGLGSLLLLAPGLIAVVWSARKLLALAGQGSDAGYRLDPDKGKYVRDHRSGLNPRSLLYMLVLATGAVLLWLNFPYTVASIHPYDTDAGYAPFQRFIDHVAAEGGLTFWSMPEAVDYHDLSVGPFGVRLETHPFDEAITETEGYTGFGAVYADTITTIDPGGRWDQAIASYLDGSRASPPWAIGESAFHWPGQAGKQFDDVLTVLLVPEPSRAAAFDALANGRFYAVRKDQGPSLRLAEFALAPAGADQDEAVARAGDTQRIGDNAELELRLRVEEAAGAVLPVEIEVIRGGAVHRRYNGATPLEIGWLETVEAEVRHTYYRVVVRGPRPAYLVSNPIFVRRGR